MKLVWLVAVWAAVAAAEPACIKEKNKAPKDPEGAARKLLTENKIGDDEIFARLVYAETLASNCAETEEGDAVMRGIAWVVRNRTLEPKRYGVGTAVVTAAKQFRSTLGTYDVSRRGEFLCPTDAALFKRAQAAWAATTDPNLNPLPTARHYYLSRHFEKSKKSFPPPAWTRDPNVPLVPALAGLARESACISFWN